MDAGYFRLLFAYNDWANQRVLDAAAALPEPDLVAPAGLSQGSVLGALAHVLGAEATWLARWQGQSPSSIAEADDFPSLAALRDRWAVHKADLAAFLATLEDSDLDRVIHYRNSHGRPFENVLAHLMAHVVNHGTQFRAEAAVGLSRRGRSPGDLDLIAYLRAGGG